MTDTTTNRVIFGDCRESMRDLIAQGVRVQMCVTSPPYFGLRDYGHPGQLGLEDSPQEYIDNMVGVFRLVRDLLADDGTLWLNIGDSYAGSWSAQGRPNGNGEMATRSVISARQINAHPRFAGKTGTIGADWGLKPKDLMGIPWRLALALQADGWYLRQDIIWSKPNPMPESIKDRCTKAHEYLFLLSKSERYFFDFEAFQEPVSGTANSRRAIYKTPDGWDTSKGEGGHGNFHKTGREKGRKLAAPGSGIKNNSSFSEAVSDLVEKRNRRSVWTIPTQPYSGAHFATFPRALIEPCILAGSRSGDIVLDPFIGSGTTGQVSQALGRRWIGCDIQSDYQSLQAQRTAQAGLKFGA